LNKVRLLNNIYTDKYKLFIIISFMSAVVLFMHSNLEITLLYMCYSFIMLIMLFFSFSKINSIFVKLTSTIWYISYVITIPIIYVNIDNFNSVGWNAVGTFDFSVHDLFYVIGIVVGYFFLFLMSSFIIEVFIKNKYFYTVNNKSYTIKTNKLIYYLFIFLLLIQFPLDTFMLHNAIGIVGIKQGILPFHLTGILYYYRLFIIPIVTFILLFSKYNKNYKIILLLIFLEIVYSGITSVSRSLLILHMLPLLYYFYIKNNKKMLFISIVMTLILFSIVSLFRNYIYLVDSFSSINFSEIITFLFFDNSQNLFTSIFNSVLNIITRLLGIVELIPTLYNTYDIKFVSHTYFLEYFLNLNFFHTNFDAVQYIYGIKLPEDKAYGIALDLFSYIYLSSINILEAFYLLFIYSFVGIISEKFLKIMLLPYIKENNFILLFHVAILLSIPNDNIRLLIFKGIPIIFIIYIFFNIIIKHKYIYKASYQ